MTTVCIAGMHRSGTSMVTRLLNLSGMYLGAESDVFVSAPDNPEGFWENQLFLRINDGILAKHEGAWDMPPLFPVDWEKSPDMLPYHLKAHHLIDQFKNQKFWGWKDPRNSLTIDFWASILPKLKVVICIRNPVEVAQSLSRRGYASFSFSFNLWLTYNRRLLSLIPPKNRIVTHFDSYFANPRAELLRLLDFLDMPASKEQIDLALNSINLPLRHNSSNLYDLLDRSPSIELVELYQQLCLEAGPIYDESTGGNPVIPNFSLESYEKYKKSTERLFEEQLAEREQQIAEREQQIAEREQQIAEREQQIAERDQQIVERDQQIAERDQQIWNIKNSSMWKIMSVFHRIRILIAPDDSLRNKILQKIWKFISLPFARMQSNRNIAKNLKLIRSSGLFDETWYLLNNPDVANTKIDPARHYILFGGFEGRDPSSHFNSSLYLNTYQDVKRVKINPLVHYLLSGSKEGRVAYPSQQLASNNIQKKEVLPTKNKLVDIRENKGENLSFLIRIAFRVVKEQGFRAFLYKTYLKITQLIFGTSKPVIAPDLEQKYNAIPISVPNKIEKSEQLSIKFQQYLINDKYVISISHDNYINHTGGVQVRISDEQIVNNSKGISYLHLYPNTHKPNLARENEPFYVGVNCDGINIGITDSDELLTALKQLESKSVINVHIHHTMGFDIHLLHRILGELGNSKGRFWLHDYFSLCPGYNLLYNDRQYCGAPNIDSNACLVCIYGTTRRKQQSAFVKLFEDYQLEVVAPSSYALALWKEKFPVPVTSEKVISLATMKWSETTRKRKTNNPLRIGFVGYPVYHKGWETWLRLVNQFSNDARYKFFLFSNTPLVSNKYKRVNVTVAKEKRLSMVKALTDNQIDVAFLWSPWPETFSFTLHESLAAGCYILTHKDSGNIQNYLMENANRGSILEDEQVLFKLFSSNDLISIVADYQRNGKPQAELVFLPEPE